MGLFFKSKQKSTPKPDPKPTKRVYSFPHSDHFRGFKKFGISTFDDPEAQKNCLFFQNHEINPDVIRFEIGPFSGSEIAQIYIEDKRIGNFYDDKQISLIENGSIDKVHVERKDTDKLALFVHYVKEGES